MYEKVSRSHVFIGGAVGLTLALALAVAVGMVPRVGEESPATQLSAAAAAPPVPVVAVEAQPAIEAPAPDTAPPAPVSRRSSAVAEAPQSEEAAPEASETPAPTPAAATGVARVQPSSAQVQAAIQGFKQRIPFFTPTAAQVADFGNQVCSAFDQGQSYAQVKATGLQMVSKYPVNVSSADADWMIHTAVSLYCPGYAGKLG